MFNVIKYENMAAFAHSPFLDVVSTVLPKSKEVILWNIQTGQVSVKITIPPQPRLVCHRQDSTEVAAFGCESKDIQRYNLEIQEQTHLESFPRCPGQAYALPVSTSWHDLDSN